MTQRVFTEASILVTCNVCYVMTTEQVGESVMRKTTFLDRGKIFILMNHQHSIVEVRSTTVRWLESFSALRWQCMNPGSGKKLLLSLKYLDLLRGPPNLLTLRPLKPWGYSGRGVRLTSQLQT